MSKLPIIILHGWGSSSAAWEVTKQLLEKSRLPAGRQGYQVLVPDLPGFGKEPPPKKPWSVSDYVDWVLDKFGQLDKFVLIGHSFGGRIAIKLAAQSPEKVEKLILTGAAGIRFASLKERMKITLFLLGSKIFNLFFYLPPFNFIKPLSRKILYYLLGAKDYVGLHNETIKETFKKVINEDLVSQMRQIKVPTLLVWGEKDLVLPLYHAKLMQKEISGSKLEIIKDAGHWFPYKTHPEIFVEKVLEFLRE